MTTFSGKPENVGNFTGVGEKCGKNVVRENCLVLTLHLELLNILGNLEHCCSVVTDNNVCMIVCKTGKNGVTSSWVGVPRACKASGKYGISQTLQLLLYPQPCVDCKPKPTVSCKNCSYICV